MRRAMRSEPLSTLVREIKAINVFLSDLAAEADKVRGKAFYNLTAIP